MGCFLQSAILPRRYMLRERQGALEPTSRLQVRDARSLGLASESVFKGIPALSLPC